MRLQRAMRNNRKKDNDNPTPSDWKPWERSKEAKEKECQNLKEKYYRLKELEWIVNKSYSRIRRLIKRKYLNQCTNKMGIYFVPKKLLPQIAKDLRVELDA